MSDNTMLLIKEGSPIAELDIIASLRKMIEELGYKGCSIFVVRKFEDIAVFSEREMNELGWYKMSQLQRVIAKKAEYDDEEQGKNGERDS